MADRDFRNMVYDACGRALVELGFKRPRRGAIYLEIKPDFRGWIGLNVGNHGDMVRINPNIGIHCVEITRLRNDLLADKKSHYRLDEAVTYSLPLGTQTPRGTDAIQFFVGAPIEGEARRLSMLIGEYGVPWMLKHASYEALLPLLEEDFAHMPNYPWQLAAMYFFAGRPEKAVEFTHGVLKRFRAEGDKAMLESFERFATPFLQMIDGE